MSHAGTADGSFGANGAAVISFPNSPAPDDSIDGLAIQAGGKFVVVGSGVSSPLADGKSVIDVARFNANGSIDTSFGTLGYTTISSVPVVVSSPGLLPTFGGLALQPDGKIVVVDYDQTTGIQITRLTANGALDTSFAGTGSVQFGFKAGLTGTAAVSSVAGAVAVQPADGKIVVAGGASQLAGGANVDVARFNANGSPDPSFGSAGQVAITIPGTVATKGTTSGDGPAAGLAIQPDGKIDLAATAGYNTPTDALAAVRLNANGTPDTSFGTGGQVVLYNPPEGSEEAEGLTLQADGKLILTAIGKTSIVPFPIEAEADRLNTNGSIDATFGSNSRVMFVGNGGLEDNHVPAVIQPDGDIVVGIPSAGLFFLRPNGTNDSTVGTGGQVKIPNGFFSSVVAEAVQSNGQIVAATSFEITRLLTQGATGDFNNDGISDPTVYIPSLGAFAYRPSSGGPDVIKPFGLAGAGQSIPAPGEYDGQSDLAVYLPSIGDFGIREQNRSDQLIPFGIAGAGQTLPAPGAYDTPGQDDIAAYLPSKGAFEIQRPNFTNQMIPFGIAGAGQSLPAPGDYNGDGLTDLAVYLPSLGAFAIRMSGGHPDHIIPFGLAGAGQSIPMPGDYDGSGQTEFAVYLPKSGLFAYRPANGGPDVITSFGIPGSGQTLPMPGDYDGSGHTELGVYLPSLGAFAYRPAKGGPDVFEAIGIPGSGQTLPFNDIPLTPAGSSGGMVAAESLDFLPDPAPKHKASGNPGYLSS